MASRRFSSGISTMAPGDAPMTKFTQTVLKDETIDSRKYIDKYIKFTKSSQFDSILVSQSENHVDRADESRRTRLESVDGFNSLMESKQ